MGFSASAAERVLDVQSTDDTAQRKLAGRPRYHSATGVVSAPAQRYRCSAQELGDRWRRLWNSLAGLGRRFDHGRIAARGARAQDVCSLEVEAVASFHLIEDPARESGLFVLCWFSLKLTVPSAPGSYP